MESIKSEDVDSTKMLSSDFGIEISSGSSDSDISSSWMFSISGSSRFLSSKSKFKSSVDSGISSSFTSSSESDKTGSSKVSS